LKNIHYSKQTKLAEWWKIYDCVVINPRIARGKPVLQGRGISTFVLAGAFRANGGNTDFVADLYDVTPEEVEAAARFEDKILVSHAA